MKMETLCKQLMNLDTACICDASKLLKSQDSEVEKIRVVDPAIRPIRTGLKLVGPAHTVSCYEDFLTVIKALRDARAGEVLVIDSQQSRYALAGELFPTEALRKGLAGIVVDGPCRDTAAITQLDLPYYARSINAQAGTTTSLYDTQVPVLCGGVRVSPGDILFGDDDGLIVATLEEWSRLIPVAEQIQRMESIMLKQMSQGKSLLDMMNFEEHCEAVRAGKKSQLAFKLDSDSEE